MYLKEINFGNRGNWALKASFRCVFVEQRSSQVNRDQQLMQKKVESIRPLAIAAAFYTFNQAVCRTDDRRRLMWDSTDLELTHLFTQSKTVTLLHTLV